MGEGDGGARRGGRASEDQGKLSQCEPFSVGIVPSPRLPAKEGRSGLRRTDHLAGPACIPFCV